MYKIKEIIIVFLIIVIIGAVTWSILPKKEQIVVPDNNITNTDEQKPIEMCYYRSTKTDRGFYDVAWIKLNILGEKITGEFKNLPAESDSKVGAFEGNVGPLDQKLMGRRANVWWDSTAEGMNVKEELEIIFGEGSATVGFGEMIDRGDGVYVYKNKTNLYYIDQMNQIDCEMLDEKLFTEQYIRDNIVTIATNKPVLGGTWYVITTIANPIAHTAEVVYEDGHIQSKANIIYTYNKNPQTIAITKFEVIN
jgi:hypothetical protein